MRQFTDSARPVPRTWTLEINIAAAKRVRDLCKVDLFALVKDGAGGLDDLLADPIGLVDVLYVLVQPQCEQAGVTDVQFGEGMAGDALEIAADAFVEELVDFFPRARARTSLRKVIDASRKVRDRVLEHAQRKVEEIDPEEIARQVIADLEQRATSGAPSGNGPASLDSTPGLSR